MGSGRYCAKGPLVDSWRKWVSDARRHLELAKRVLEKIRDCKQKVTLQEELDALKKLVDEREAELQETFQDQQTGE